MKSLLTFAAVVTALAALPASASAGNLNAAQLKGYTQFVNGKVPADGAAACNAACAASHEYWLLEPETQPQIDQHGKFIRETDSIRRAKGVGKFLKAFGRVNAYGTAFYVGWKIGSAGREYWMKAQAHEEYDGGFDIGNFAAPDGETCSITGHCYANPLYSFRVMKTSPYIPASWDVYTPERPYCYSNTPLNPSFTVFVVKTGIVEPTCSGGPSDLIRTDVWAPATVDVDVPDPGTLGGDSTITAPQTGEPDDATETEVQQELQEDQEKKVGIDPVFDPDGDGSTEDGPMGEFNDPGSEGSGDGTEPMTPPGGGAGMCEPWVKPNLNFSPLNKDFGSVFPFGVPIWLWGIASAWSRTGDAPSFTIDFSVSELTIDFAVLDPVINVIRPILLIGAIVGLVIVLSGWALGAPGSSVKE